MLPKSQRLNLKKDFKWLVSGKKIETKYLKLYFITGENQMPRLGIAVSSKNFKKAVDRNRARRLTSASFEALYSRLPSRINILALPKVSLIRVKSGDVLLDLEAVLKDNNLLSQNVVILKQNYEKIID